VEDKVEVEVSCEKKELLRKYMKKLHDKKINRIETIGQKFLSDYTEFSYKIDSVLNEAFMHIKRLEQPVIKKTKFGNYD
jgi:hypothetical protein